MSVPNPLISPSPVDEPGRPRHRHAVSSRLAVVLIVLASVGILGVRAQTDTPPTKPPSTVVVGCYNIKWLGQWTRDLAHLAKAVSVFDVCGILEVKDESAIRSLRDALEKETGESWGYVYGVRTHRPHGRYHEAYAAVWRRDRVQLGDGVISNVWDLEESFRNDPYLVSFRAGNFDFTLLLVHTRWSDDAEGSRAGEVAALVNQVVWIRGVIHDEDLIICGDFNYAGSNTNMREMANQAGLTQIDPDENSTYKTDGSGYASTYDHMYIDSVATREFTGTCRVYDPTKAVFGTMSAADRIKARRELSDHLPVYATFRTDMPDDD